MAEAKIRVQVALDYPEGWTERERDSERRHRERMATIQAETEARVLAQAVSYPSDYELWRDALLISATLHSGQDMDKHNKQADVETDAEWFFRPLLKQAGPTPPPVPDCQHCGADSSMDHDEECPNAPIRWYVACGCGSHGDHLGCNEGCATDGCQHRVGREFTAATELQADNHIHSPACQRGKPEPDGAS